MASNVVPFRTGNAIFPDGVPRSQRAEAEQAARVAEAEKLRKKLLDRDHTNEIYGAAVATYAANLDDVMPTPDTVAWDNGGYQIYDDMAANVLHYASLRTGRIKVATALPLVWLPGQKGNPESEQARNEVASAWENVIADGGIDLDAACAAFERGFAPLENIFDEHTRGAAKGFIAIVSMIDRPLDWFGFDYRNRPVFKQRYYQRDPQAVDDYKVSFMRCGSLHTRYGKGYGPECYPAVFAIDAHMRGISRETERFGYMPIVVTYPKEWREDGHDYLQLRANIDRQWKNWLLLPGEVSKPEYDWPSAEAAYASANAIGAMRLKVIEKYEAWLAMRIQGSQYSSGNRAEGSYARDQVASSDRLWNAPSDARYIEAMLNRHFMRPMMLVNRPQTDPSLWPRAAIDASFGEDLRFLMELFDQAAKLKIPVATVTWSERFKIPLSEPGSGEPLIQAPQVAVPAQPADAAAQDSESVQFAEPDFIEIVLRNGKRVKISPDDLIYTENRGTVLGKLLQTGDVPTYRAVSRA